MVLCPFLMIAHASGADGRIGAECVGERCAMWDRGEMYYEGIYVPSGTKPGCSFVPRAIRRGEHAPR